MRTVLQLRLSVTKPAVFVLLAVQKIVVQEAKFVTQMASVAHRATKMNSARWKKNSERLTTVTSPVSRHPVFSRATTIETLANKKAVNDPKTAALQVESAILSKHHTQRA
jgi:hypothetical protein